MYYFLPLIDACLNVALFFLQMLKLVTGEDLQASPPTVLLNMSGEYEIQVATHLTLVQLQAFSWDVVRYLRFLDQTNEEDTER